VLGRNVLCPNDEVTDSGNLQQASTNTLAIEFNIDEEQKMRPQDALFVEPKAVQVSPRKNHG